MSPNHGSPLGELFSFSECPLDPVSLVWLVRVDRQAWPLFLKLLGEGPAPAETPGLSRSRSQVVSPEVLVGAEVGPEVGEEWRLVTLPEPAPATRLLATGLPRFVLPVDLILDLPSGPDTAPFGTRLASYAEAQRVRGVRALSAWALRRHGRFKTDQLNTWGPSVLGEEPPGPWDRQVLVAVGDRQLFAGAASLATCGATLPGGPRAMARRLDAPSRARGKMVEALAWLASWGLTPRPGALWLELGAFPGGMTSELVRSGYRVLAVDVQTPSPAMRALPGVAFHVGRIAAFVPTQPCDALLCDVNGPPLATLAEVARLAASLVPGGILVHTLKLPRWDAYPQLLAMATDRFAAAGLQALAVKHLAHNRQEVTILGRKIPDRGP